MRRLVCYFHNIEDRFNFGRYRGLSLADVLDINPSYVNWCVKHCTGIRIIIYDNAVEEIRAAYPTFIMDKLFESCRNQNIDDLMHIGEENNSIDRCDYKAYDYPTYECYGGSWAQDVEGYSDDDIDIIFDGDPSAYWNID